MSYSSCIILFLPTVAHIVPSSRSQTLDLEPGPSLHHQQSTRVQVPGLRYDIWELGSDACHTTLSSLSSPLLFFLSYPMLFTLSCTLQSNPTLSFSPPLFQSSPVLFCSLLYLSSPALSSPLLLLCSPLLSSPLVV
jgi:hypothetical protein